MEKGRVQSPSSIKTYKQCPRKYYYQYIEKIPTSPNVHTVRGNIAHSALEHFFDIDTSVITLENYQTHLKLAIQRILLHEWTNYKDKIEEVGLTKEKEMFYFEETMMMLLNWIEQFCDKIKKQEGTFKERFDKLTPIREEKYESQTYRVQGFIDAIEKQDGTIKLMDYKTSKTENLNEHILQLAIYSLLYYEKHGHLPTHVGVYFLKGKEHALEVDEKLLELAKKEITKVHACTQTNHIDDYQKKPSPLCKWSSGKCDFYDICKPHG